MVRFFFKKPSANEKIRNEIYPEIFSGILDFVDAYRSRFKSGLPLWNVSDLTMWLNLFCVLPTNSDRRAFSLIMCASDARHLRWKECMRCWPRENGLFSKFVNANYKLFKSHISGEALCLSFFGVPFMKVKGNVDRDRIYLFGIPFFERDYRNGTVKDKLFSIVPLASYDVCDGK